MARLRLKKLHYHNVEVKFSDGNLGWPQMAPFDGIIVTAGIAEIPPALLEQLAEGGRLVIPVGEAGNQNLLLVTREQDQFYRTELEPVRFVPLLPGVR